MPESKATRYESTVDVPFDEKADQLASGAAAVAEKLTSEYKFHLSEEEVVRDSEYPSTEEFRELAMEADADGLKSGTRAKTIAGDNDGFGPRLPTEQAVRDVHECWWMVLPFLIVGSALVAAAFSLTGRALVLYGMNVGVFAVFGCSLVACIAMFPVFPRLERLAMRYTANEEYRRYMAIGKPDARSAEEIALWHLRKEYMVSEMTEPLYESAVERVLAAEEGE